jgi:hypothetical protein
LGVCAARLELARLLWEQPEHRAEARALAEAAALGFRSQALDTQADMAEQWLDEHRERADGR